MSNFLIHLLTIFMIGLMLIGILIIILTGRKNVMAIRYVIIGASTLVVIFLVENPNIVESLKEHIALTLIGLVIATISIIRFIINR